MGKHYIFSLTGLVILNMQKYKKEGEIYVPDDDDRNLYCIKLMLKVNKNISTIILYHYFYIYLYIYNYLIYIYI